MDTLSIQLEEAKTEHNSSLFEHITANMSQLVKRDNFDDKKYLVVPTVLMVEGVLNGILYTKEEMSKYPKAWNGIEVPVYHTYDVLGQPMSANNPKTLEKQSIGRLFNVYFETNKLKGEVWVNIEKCKRIAPDVLKMLENNEHIEVSTALFTDEEKISGSFNGKEYSSIARNFRPDHFAVLPNEIGACSWEDGAGMPRLNKEAGGKMEDLKTLVNKMASIIGLSFQKEDKTLTQKESDLNNKLIKGELPVEGAKLTQPIVQDKAEKEVVIANKETEVTAVVADEAVSVVAEKTTDEVKPKLDIKILTEEQETIVTGSSPVAESISREMVIEVTEPTMEEFVASAPASFREILESGLRMHNEAKSSFIGGLLASKRNKFTKDELQVKTNEELAKLVDLSGTEKNYTGKAGSLTVHTEKKLVPDMAVMTWTEEV